MPDARGVSFVDLLKFHPLPELATAVRSRIDAVMARWEESARQVLPKANQLTFRELRNDSHDILAQLADALASANPAATDAMAEGSRQHAAVRFDEKYDLRELIIEYRLLRRIIVEEVESALGRSASLTEQVTLHMGVDTMLQRGVLAFVEYQQSRFQALTEKATKTAAATARQARDAAWTTAEQAKIAAAATSEQARNVAWATAQQATAAAWAASEQARDAVAVATERARDAATVDSDEASAAALATSEEAKDVALATSDKARDVALAFSEHAKDVAAAASEVKDRFLAVLSHELRNPLTPVLATASLLQQDKRFDQQTREHLEVIRRNAELEARLIDDLLDVTRISHGKVHLDRQPTELSTILRHAVEVCQGDIDVRRLHFTLVINDPPHIVDADSGRLQQVFWNIIKNAVKFTPCGGCVGVRAYRRDQSAIVEVTDSGMGMEPEALTRVFSAFEQAEASVTRQFGGLGLGLAISRALVELHGGAITAQSPGKDKGATFRVRLPLIAATPQQASSAPHTLQPAQAPPASPPPARRILLVEDHGDTARILARILTNAGHTVQTAADVASALELAGAPGAEFDLLLSDMGLPDGSGLDLLKELRKRGNALAAVALSGYGQEEDLRLSREAGFSHHLLKPVTAERLLATVASKTC